MRTKQEKALNDYINLKHNQAECTGFIDGYDAGIKDADEFACAFAEWKDNYFHKMTLDEFIHEEAKTATELLEIFKKEQDGK